MTKLNTSLNKYISGSILMIFFIFGLTSRSIAQEHGVTTEESPKEEIGAIAHDENKVEEKFNMQDMIFNHINNSNEFHLFGHYAIPLPCILYSREDGITTFLSSKLEHGQKAFNRYVLDHGTVKRLPLGFPEGEVAIGHMAHEKVNKIEFTRLMHDGVEYEVQSASNLMKFTSFYDFSISKNVFTMLLAALILCLIFLSVAKHIKQDRARRLRGFRILWRSSSTLSLTKWQNRCWVTNT